MKKKSISSLLVLSLLSAIILPSVQCVADEEKSSIFTTDRELIYYEEAAGIRMTLELFFRSDDLVFSAYYDNEPGVFYEFKTSAESFDTTDPDWTKIKRFCLENRDSWNRRCVSDEVQVEDRDDSLTWSATYDGNYVYVVNGLPGDTAYFTSWLQSYTHSAPFRGEILSTGFYQGFMLYQKIGLEFSVGLTRTHLIGSLLTAAQLILAVFEKDITTLILAAITLLLDVATDYFQAGTRVLTYGLLADWFKYVTFGPDPGFPYAKADKNISWIGYGYNQTGNFSVEENPMTSYAPPNMYNQTSQAFFSAAYNQYLITGFKSGDY